MYYIFLCLLCRQYEHCVSKEEDSPQVVPSLDVHPNREGQNQVGDKTDFDGLV